MGRRRGLSVGRVERLMRPPGVQGVHRATGWGVGLHPA